MAKQPKQKPAAGKKPGRAGKKPGAGAGDPKLPSVANHPRAGAQVARAKAWGGLVGFALVGLLSWRAGAPVADVLLRALAGGVVGYVATWAAAVLVWRHLVVAELRAVRAHRAAEVARRAAAATQRADS